MRTILLPIYLMCACITYGQVQQQAAKVQLAMETYAFLKGQSAALKKVSGQFPCFSAEVFSLQKDAQGVFGRAEKNIEHFLGQQLDELQWSSFQKYIDSQIKEQLKNPIQNKKSAGEFLRNAKDKIGFRQGTALPKGLLSFAYQNAPHQEVIDGHRIEFTTEGHPKAEGTVVAFPIPKSWSAQEAEMPAAVQQFTSFDGKGNEKIVILIHTLPLEYQNLAPTEKSVKEMIPPQSRLIRTEPVTIDDMPGIMAEIEEILDPPTNNSKVRMLQFMLCHKQKLYCLQGSVGPVPLHQNPDQQLRAYEPLFRLVAKSVQID